ncbi:hypothetical protein HBB16_10005 [Pseudonocardia sp. MCCB 268]|nr:hypothetical protein [Pseudonocardia cytotoxica]
MKCAHRGLPAYPRGVPAAAATVAEAGVPDPVELRTVADGEQAQRERFHGSPTIRVDGRDDGTRRGHSAGLRAELPALSRAEWDQRHAAGRVECWLYSSRRTMAGTNEHPKGRVDAEDDSDRVAENLATAARGDSR